MRIAWLLPAALHLPKAAFCHHQRSENPQIGSVLPAILQVTA
jgi:hypothetical protein